jgi:hypothetical protein
MTTFQNALSSPRFNRLLLWFSALVLLAGVFLVVNNLAGGSDGAQHSPDKGFRPTLPTKDAPLKNAAGAQVTTFEQLDPQTRTTIRTFLATAVSRKNLGESWAVVAPSMRTGYTYSQWKNAKELPVIPYPIDDVDTANYSLEYATKKEVLIEVGLSAKNKVERPRRFRLGLSPVGKGTHKRWLVSYWMPLWTPLLPIN